jgi:hypothetical protein
MRARAAVLLSGVLHSRSPGRQRLPAAFRTQRGPLTWYVDVIENIVHDNNTPDVGAHLGATWKLGAREAHPARRRPKLPRRRRKPSPAHGRTC